MKKIFEHWWKNQNRCFSIINYKKSWKEVGNPPRLFFKMNGARRGVKEDTCLDVMLIIGYTIFNYTNFDFNKEK